MTMKPYVIRQGDYVLKLSHLHGFDANKVWNDGKNAELKKLRKDPSLLKPGDILFVPDEPKKRLKVNAKETNAYVARVPTVKVNVVISEDDEPLKDAKYVVEGMGDDETEYATDGEGTVSFEAPVHIREVTVRFLESTMKFRIAIGDLDPPDTPSGARMRLQSLGLYGAKTEGADGYVARDENGLAGAIRAFQAKNGIDVTGLLDKATQDALVAAHGS